MRALLLALLGVALASLWIQPAWSPPPQAQRYVAPTWPTKQVRFHIELSALPHPGPEGTPSGVPAPAAGCKIVLDHNEASGLEALEATLDAQGRATLGPIELPAPPPGTAARLLDAIPQSMISVRDDRYGLLDQPVTMLWALRPLPPEWGNAVRPIVDNPTGFAGAQRGQDGVYDLTLRATVIRGMHLTIRAVDAAGRIVPAEYSLEAQGRAVALDHSFSPTHPQRVFVPVPLEGRLRVRPTTGSFQSGSGWYEEALFEGFEHPVRISTNDRDGSVDVLVPGVRGISGQILSTSGDPLGGVDILVCRSGRTLSEARKEGEPSFARMGGKLRTVVEASVDREGHFDAVFPSSEKGPFDVYANRIGETPQRIAAGVPLGAHIEHRLAVGVLRIELPQFSPAERVNLTMRALPIQPPTASGADELPGDGSISFSWGNSGLFGPLVPGSSVRVQAAALGYRHATRTVRVPTEGGETSVRILLERVPRGTVYLDLPEGAPAPTHSLPAQVRETESRFEDPFTRAETTATGWVLRDLPRVALSIHNVYGFGAPTVRPGLTKYLRPLRLHLPAAPDGSDRRAALDVGGVVELRVRAASGGRVLPTETRAWIETPDGSFRTVPPAGWYQTSASGAQQESTVRHERLLTSPVVDAGRYFVVVQGPGLETIRKEIQVEALKTLTLDLQTKRSP